MAAGKYEHLIKPLSIGAINLEETRKTSGALISALFGPGNASREIRLIGRDHLEGLNLSLSWGVHSGLGEWHPGLDPHVHPYAECLLFVGLDTANAKYLGAEIDCCLGEEEETYTFNEPTAIVIPAGLPHGPIITKRMFSPRGFGCWAIELNSTTEITWLGDGVDGLSEAERNSAPEGLHFAAPENVLRKKPSAPTGKYAHLVKSLKPTLIIERGKYAVAMEEKNQSRGQKLGPGNADHLMMMSGKALEGVNASIFWGFCSQSGIWHRGTGAHVHPTDEVLIYVVLDPHDADSLDAEIEIDLGSEHERYLISKPSIVVCPAGMPHLPQVTRWVDKPFAFFAVNLSGEHEVKPFD